MEKAHLPNLIEKNDYLTPKTNHVLLSIKLLIQTSANNSQPSRSSLQLRLHILYVLKLHTQQNF